MKLIAMLLNTALFIVGVILIVDEIDNMEIAILLLGSLLLGTPLVNVFVILRSSNISDTWLSLYLKRKKLEEKARIEQLTSSPS